MNNGFFVTRSGRIAQKTSLDFVIHRALTSFYLVNGRKTGTKGYGVYCREQLGKLVYDRNLLELFKYNQPLPKGYGYRLDERVIEYPWVLSRLSADVATLLDAGSTLNFEYLLTHSNLSQKQIVIYTLSPNGENTIPNANVSYVYGDLRSTILRDELFDEIVCISTIEHIGMDNSIIYTDNAMYREKKHEDYKFVIKELRRLLKPTGKLLITVPFGRFQNLNWLQQFDRTTLSQLIETFNGNLQDIAYYRYNQDGWQISTESESADCEYNDLLTTKFLAPDGAVAARSVACIELKK